jgi:hypothetical protein
MTSSNHASQNPSWPARILMALGFIAAFAGIVGGFAPLMWIAFSLALAAIIAGEMNGER